MAQDNKLTSKILLERLLSKYGVKKLANHLNLAVGTIHRWRELDNIPPHYEFDLLRLSNLPIVVSQYNSSQKDQFYTSLENARKCYFSFLAISKISTNEYIFIEPSAGDGSFLNFLPSNTIAMDIEPRANHIITQDYLKWQPHDMSKQYIVIGNPPFGLRGHMALNFINHSYDFADYVVFILPQLFFSDGKGSPRKRVKGYNLIHSEKLSS